ncbi:MAG: 3-dehydroquinate synthase [Firmicutes bacterium]|nr:3-dehydroquinate synthase [Bacillota bacterium]
MRTITIRLPAAAYPILIGNGALAEAAETLCALCPGKRVFVVTDENVWALHGARLDSVLAGQGISYGLKALRPGEESKTLATLEGLYGAFHAAGMQRRDPVVAFGGGVVGDTAGFAAATYMRGVPLVQIPTTLLAQADASVGGKVAVDLPQGKNLAGCFYQPSLVVADTAVLSTLPPREWNAGLAEVVKHAAIGSEELLALLEGGRVDAMEEIVALNCQCKASFVERDSLDQSVRMMLNFGHTFGHAIEKYHDYKTYTHGEAVAMGMGLALQAGRLLGVTPPEDARRLLSLMERLGLDAHAKDPADALVPLMAGDKKNIGGDINLVLLAGIGRPVPYPIQPQALASLLAGGNM